MNTLSLRLPDSLYKEIISSARKEWISINQFIFSAAAEKMSALLTESYLKEKSLESDKDFSPCNVKSSLC